MPDVKISQLSPVSVTEKTDIFEISRSLGGGSGYESRSITYQGLIDSLHGSRTITVNCCGTADYDNIKDALAYASTVAGPTNPIVLLVYPGTYLEENPLVVPDYVSIKSMGGQFTTAVGALNSEVIFQNGYRSIIQGLSIQATSGVGYMGTTAFYIIKPLCIVEDCVIVNCENGIWADGVAADSSVVLDCGALNFTTSKIVRAYYATNGANLVVKTSLTNSINPANLIDYGLYCDNSNMYCSSINFSECDTAIYATNGGDIEINSSYIYNGTKGLVTSVDGSNSRIHAVGVNIDPTVTGNHIENNSVTGHIDLIGAYESYKRSLVSGSQFHSFAQDRSTMGTTIIGDTKVENRFDIGIPAKEALGLEIGVDIGTGRGYSSDRFGGEVVEYWAYDDSAPSGSKFTRYANNAGTQLTDDGDALVVGSRYDYSSLELDILQAVNLGSSSIITEHWDGSQWVEHYTCTYGRADFTHRQNNFFQNVETQYVEHGRDVYDDWDPADDITDEIPAWDLGTDMYTVRFRNNGGSIVTPAIFENGRVKADNFSIQVSGEAATWGRNRISETSIIEASLWSFDSVNPPARVDIDITANMSVTDHPSFLDNAVCQASVLTKVPLWVDTSTPLTINCGMFCPTSAASSDANFTIRVAIIRPNLIAGTIPEETYIVTETMSGVANKFQQLRQEINIQEVQPGWNLLIGISRDATGANPLDTFTGDVVFMGIGFNYTRKIIG